MKEEFKVPEIEIIYLDYASDIVTASDSCNGEDELDEMPIPDGA